jgi:hypothetical protein
MFSAAIPLRGARGAIRWFYYTAADVTNFTVVYSRDRAAWTLQGGVVAPDAFKLGQAPLEFVAPTKGGGALRWPVLSLSVRDGRVTATLGAPITAGSSAHEPIRSP